MGQGSVTVPWYPHRFFHIFLLMVHFLAILRVPAPSAVMLQANATTIALFSVSHPHDLCASGECDYAEGLRAGERDDASVGLQWRAGECLAAWPCLLSRAVPCHEQL